MRRLVVVLPLLHRDVPVPQQLINLLAINTVQQGVKAYAGAARRRVHLVTVLLQSPSGHRPGRRQARHAHIPQIGLRLTIAQADARPAMPVSLR